MKRPLSELGAGDSGRILDFAGFDANTERLMQMGLVEGTEVRFIRSGPGGDPIEIDVMGYSLSLRREEAAQVIIESNDEPG